MPAVPLPARPDRPLDDGGDAFAIDVLHREDVDAGVANRDLFSSVEIPDPDEDGVRGQHLR